MLCGDIILYDEVSKILILKMMFYIKVDDVRSWEAKAWPLTLRKGWVGIFFYYARVGYFLSMVFFLNTAATVADPTKHLETREAGFLYVPQQPCRFSQVSLTH